MTQIKRLLKDVLPLAFFAGIVVGIAGTIFSAMAGEGNKVLGAFLFSGGLLLVCVHSLNLFTGKVGYVIDRKPIFLLDLLVMLIGNVLGAGLIALIVKMANITSVIESVEVLVSTKLSHEWWETLGLSILCGIMMYLAVEGWNRVKNDVAKTLLVVILAMIFLMAGFEHSIANIYYFMLNGTLDLKAFGYILLMLLGNGLGAILLNLVEKAAKLKK